MTDAETALRVAEALETTCKLRNPRKRAALKLGWTISELRAWEETHVELLEISRAAFIQSQQPKAEPPTEDILYQPDQIPLSDAGPSPEATALAVRESNEKIMEGFKAMNFTEEEAKDCMALQQFNKEHFTTLMDLSCANIMRTDVRVGMEQGNIVKRLALVRSQIAAIGEVLCEERDAWVREEAMLIKFLLQSAEVISTMHDRIIKGQAQLALIVQRNRLRPDEGNNRPWKPGFTATVEVESGT